MYNSHKQRLLRAKKAKWDKQRELDDFINNPRECISDQDELEDMADFEDIAGDYQELKDAVEELAGT